MNFIKIVHPFASILLEICKCLFARLKSFYKMFCITWSDQKETTYHVKIICVILYKIGVKNMIHIHLQLLSLLQICGLTLFECLSIFLKNVISNYLYPTSPKEQRSWFPCLIQRFHMRMDYVVEKMIILWQSIWYFKI